MKDSLLVVLCCACVIQGYSFNTKKCNLADETCLVMAAQEFLPIFTKGIPELGIERTDLLVIDRTKFDLVGLSLDLKNISYEGFRNGIIDRISFDQTKKVLNMVCRADVHMTSKYKAGGRLLVLPISGDGDLDVQFKQFRLNFTFNYEITKNSNDQDVINGTSFKYKYDVKGAHFNLTNLFNGDKYLADTMLSFINQNWKALSREFGKTVLNAPAVKVYNAIRTFLKSQPLSTILLT